MGILGGGGIQHNVKILGSTAFPGRVVLRIKYNQTCFEDNFKWYEE